MEKSLDLIGNTIGGAGVLVIFAAGVSRLLGNYHLVGFDRLYPPKWTDFCPLFQVAAGFFGGFYFSSCSHAYGLTLIDICCHL